MSDTVEYKVCGACKNEIPINNFGLHEVTCLRHHYQCHTCLEFVAKSGREDHDHLYHSMEKCEKCGTKFKPIDKEEHNSVCVKALVNCEFCESDFIRSKFSDHISACGARTEKCDSCDCYVMLRDMCSHYCNSTPHDFSVTVGTINSSSSSSRPEAMVRTRIQDRLPGYHSSPPAQTVFTPKEETGTISEREKTMKSLFPGNEREQNQTVATRERDSFRDTTGTGTISEREKTVKSLFPGNEREQNQTVATREFRDTTGTGTISEREKTVKSLFPGNEREQNQTVATREFRDTTGTGTKSDTFSVRAGSNPHLYDFRRSAEPKREPMPPLDTSPFLPSPFPSVAFLPSSPLELPEEVTTPEYQSDLSGPCEFCGNQVPLSALDGHQLGCGYRNRIDRTETKFCVNCRCSVLLIDFIEHSRTCQPRNRGLVFNRTIGPQQLRELELNKSESNPDLIPCEFCRKTFGISEISTHQNSCREFISPYQPLSEFISPYQPLREFISPYQPLSEIGMKECYHCKERFSSLELYTHQIDCLSEQQQIQQQLQHQQQLQKQQQQQQQKKVVEKSNCEFCSEEFKVKELPQHSKNCSKNPKYSCKHCLRFSSDPEHENVCSYRHFNPKDVHISDTILPFDAIEGDTAVPIDNKCIYCKFPYPALSMENHMNQCAKNPRYRQRQRRAPEPVVSEPATDDVMTFPDITPNTDTTKQGDHTPSNYENTNKLKEIYSKRDPSPHVGKQQLVASDDILPSKQQHQFTRRESPIASNQDKYQQQNIRKQQQEPAKRASISPILQFQPNTSKQQQQQQQPAIKKSSFSSTLLFQDTYQPQNTSKQQQQQQQPAIKKSSFSSTLPFQDTYQPQNTSKQQQQQQPAIKKSSFSSTLPYQDTYQPQNTSKQQQPKKEDITSPTSLFRSRDEDKYAFSHMKTIPTASKPRDFKCELTPIQTKTNINKPTDLSISNKQTNKYPNLTPTQDLSNYFNPFVMSPHKEIKYPPKNFGPDETYPKTISSPTETIIDTSNTFSSTNKRNSNSSFQDRYKSPKPKIRDF